MALTLRSLKSKHIFALSRILKKMGLKLEPGSRTQEQLGADLLLLAAENLHLAEEEVNELLGSLTGMSPEQFAELPLEEVLDVIRQLKELPQIRAFFKAAGPSRKRSS